MAYPVNLSDGTLLVNLQEFTRDTTSTSLSLFGRGIVNYGEAMAENLVHLLEHFASPSAPSNPLTGQLWFHTFEAGPPVSVVNKLKVFNGTDWVVAGGAQSSVNPPTNPEPGDLWYNMETSQIYYWDGFKWVKVGGPYTGNEGNNGGDPNQPNNPPPDPQEGDLWWMLPERQLMAYDATLANTGTFPPNLKRANESLVPNGWVLVGPVGSKTDNNYTQYTTIVNGSGQSVDVLKIVINGDLVAVWTNEPFDIEDSKIDDMDFLTYTNEPGQAGSTVLTAGLNMNHLLGMKMNGIAFDSETLDGLDSTAFLRRDQSDFPVGTDNVFDLGTTESKWRYIFSKHFYAGDSDPDGEDDIATINLHGRATYAEKTDYAEKAEMFANGKKISAAGVLAGDLTDFAATGANEYTWTYTFSQAGQDSIKDISRDVVEEVIEEQIKNNFVPLDASSVPAGQFDMGNNAQRWGTIYANVFDGEVTKARYADLAENYYADEKYEAGTLVSIGGSSEITITNGHDDTRYFGVISTKPGFLLNSHPASGISLPVALAGRVPVKVVGTVVKGERLILSSTPGVAVAYRGYIEDIKDSLFVGRALEDKTTEDIGTVLATVKSK